MELDRNYINKIVKEVVEEFERNSSLRSLYPDSVNGCIFDDVNRAVESAKISQKYWFNIPKSKKEIIITALRKSMHQNAALFSEMAVAETGMGRVEDKIVKHHNAADATPGIEDLETKSWSGDKGLVYEDYAPFGVVAAITPSTHPIPVLFNSMIIIIAAGNSVVFNVHPAAKKLSAVAVEIFNKVIRDNGGPANLVCMLREPTLESAEQIFKHPDIELIAATGGPQLVKAAFSSGKKVIAAGPGNPPVFIDETADLENAARSIVEGASFDNNILCIAEKEVFVINSVFDKFMREMEKANSIRIDKSQIKALAEKVFLSNSKNEIYVNRQFVGKNASVLAGAIGLKISDSVRLLFGECDFGCKFVQEEQMMPFIPVVRVESAEQGIEFSVKAEHGYKHTAMIHSNNLNNITNFTKAMNTSIVVVNGSSLAGNGGMSGEGTFSHTIASPTGEGICTPRNFARVRRLAITKSLQIK